MIPVAPQRVNHSLPYAIDTIRRHTNLEPLTVGTIDHGLCDHLTTREPRGRKFHGELIAIRTAVEHLGEPFIWSNDDIYWLRPATPIRWALGRLEDAERHPYMGSEYIRRKKHTAKWLTAQGLPTWDYESHTPLPIDPEPMSQVIQWCETDPMLDKRSIYGNLTGQPDLIAPDVKLRATTDPLPDAPWVSTAFRPDRYPALRAA